MTTLSTRKAAASGNLVGERIGVASLIRAMIAELTKIRSVRSAYWTGLFVVIICVGVGAVACWMRTNVFLSQLSGGVAASSGSSGPTPSPGSHQLEVILRANAQAHAASYSMFGLVLGQLVMVTLGVVVIASEYSSSTIRLSMTAVPRRVALYSAKVIVFGMVSLAIGLLASFLAFFVGQAILSTQELNTSIAAPGVLRVVVGGGLFLGVTGLLSFGIGAVTRRAAGAISAGVALMFVINILAKFLPSPSTAWYGAADVDKWLPFNAGGAIWARPEIIGVNPFSPWVGFGVFCGYAAAVIIVGLLHFWRRDA